MNLILNSTCLSGLPSILLSGSSSCNSGFYCPYADAADYTTWPQLCIATDTCRGQRLLGNACDLQSKYEPVICDAGYYCSNTVKTICPAGSYCPIGSTAPLSCDPLSACPEGSSHQTYVGGFLFILLIDIALFVLYMWKRSREKLNAAQKVKVDGDSAEKIVQFYRNTYKNSNTDMLIEYEQIQLRRGNTPILKDISGNFKPRTTTAIMGGSGAGKTSFVNVILGKVVKTGGTIKVNGETVSDMSRFKKIVGFVPQNDIMHCDLTVRENILNATHFRAPKDWSLSEIESFVDTVIEFLDLSDVAHTIVGDEERRGVNAGQKKRVNIGLELASLPLILILDEPTSGLDSAAALQIMTSIQKISKIGITVVSIIHQPRYEIFAAFDDLLMIAVGGMTAYHGPTSGFPNTSNPADVLIDIIVGKNDKEEISIITRKWKEHQDSQKQEPIKYDTSVNESISGVIKSRGASLIKQFALFHNRALLQEYRKASSFLLQMVVGVFAGILLGLLLVSNRGALYKGVYTDPYELLTPGSLEYPIPLACLLCGMAVSLVASAPAVKVFGDEKAVFARESSAGYNRIAYFLGKMAVTFYTVAIFAVHFGSFYYIVILPTVGFTLFYALLLGQFFAVYGVGAALSIALAKEKASLNSAVLSMVLSTMCGFGPSLNNVKDWGIEWLFNLSFNRWFSEALFAAETKEYLNVYEVVNISATQMWGYNVDKLDSDVGYLFLCGVCYWCLGGLMLMLINRRKEK